MRTDATELDTAIRTAGLRVTGSRRAVLEALRARPHARADEVLGIVRDATPTASLQSVYNALNDFTASGLVRRIEPAGHPMMFEVRIGDNHHHLVCTSCGMVVNVDCAIGHAPCLEPSDPHGFRVATAEVTYWGVCAACSALADDAS
ncbi:Fur family transcriptional regulator [Microbacterium sp.]|jgi:Fur family ferric uptake transcriptional regulator|uniref:Fur family transcriptional regulator n=1 Tax=Microbacterium sp. TaxID=51671 RepID=UPI002607F21A|nr:Fur family transcriptional regulator [uncultured Microbacterium sp.]